MKLRYFGLVVVLILLACGVGMTQEEKPDQAQGEDEISALLKKLTPVESGRGILICEPVTMSADHTLSAFGAACGRWLYFVVGGQGELGQTPTWNEVGVAIHEMNREDLCLSFTALAQLHTSLGVTNVATGTLTGTPEANTLTYHLWQLSKMKEDGPPIEIRGSREQIIEQLPKMATEIAQRWGVQNPRIPAVSIGAADISLLGKLPWTFISSSDKTLYTPRDILNDDNKHRLSELALKNPFVEMALGMSGSAPVLPPTNSDALLRKNLVDNVLYLNGIGIRTADDFEFFESQAAQSLAAFPDNYALMRTLSA